MAADDPDMAPDELQAAIVRAQAKRQELLDALTANRHVGNVIAALSKAAELYRRQIAAVLDGRPRETARARLLLRKIFGGKVPLTRRGKEPWAQIVLRPEALLLRAEGTDGSGGRI